MEESIDDIFGMIIILGKNYTVSEIRDFGLVSYVIFHLWYDVPAWLHMW